MKTLTMIGLALMLTGCLLKASHSSLGVRQAQALWDGSPAAVTAPLASPPAAGLPAGLQPFATA